LSYYCEVSEVVGKFRLPFVAICAATIFLLGLASDCTQAIATTPNRVSSKPSIPLAEVSPDSGNVQRMTDKVLASFHDPLTMFGFVAVTLMLVFYAFETRSPYYVLGFAIACVMGSTYGFLQGAWPFGLVEGIWSLVAFRRFLTGIRVKGVVAVD
jgi:hypothetical protein